MHSKHKRALPGVATAAAAISVAAVGFVTPAAGQQTPGSAAPIIEEVRVTAARRREESVQEVPIPISVVNGELLTDAGAFNVNRLQNLVPSVQFFSTNPRNTSVNIRGLGLPYGLTNDGIEPGVGFYVDGVLYARPAALTLDFIDVERIEVLRGPQGTLFGKNTTAGAILVTTRKPSFTPELNAELTYGDDNFTQAKASITGPLGEKVAGRLSFSSTQRDGNVFHTVQNKYINDLNNTGLRGQLLITPSDQTDITLGIDYTRQRPDGIAQVLAGVAPTYRGSPDYASALYDIPANPSANPARHFWQIIDDFDYVPPNVDRATQEVRPFDRVADTGTPWKAGNELGGVSFNLDTQVGPGTLTVTTAWRSWLWDPSNDRDNLALLVGTLSQAPSSHEQLTQEIRWAGALSSNLEGVFGFYAFDQKLRSDPVHTEAVGADYARFRHPNLVAQWGPDGTVYPNYFDGQRSEITSRLDTVSAALFGQLDWAISDRVHLLPGLRFNYDDKEIYYHRDTIGVPDPALFAPTSPPPDDDHPYGPFGTVQDVRGGDDDTDVSGQLTLAFNADSGVNYYATYANTFKSIGVNLGNNQTPIPPESVTHFEIGLKSSPTRNSTANVTLFNTIVEDFQTQVLVPGNARPVIASAEEVRTRGIEFDGSVRIGNSLSLYGALAYTDAEYTSFDNAPVPLELTGYTADGLPQVSATGGRLPGVSEWAASFGGEYRKQVDFLGTPGELVTGFDLFYRDDFSSSATPSEYLNIDGYSLVNLRVGFRSNNGWSTYFWTRNAFDEEYVELLQAAPAGQGAGHYAAALGDPRYYGFTLRIDF